MNRLRNFITGSSEYDDDNYPPDNQNNNNANNNNNQSSWSSKYGYNNNNNSKQQRSQYHNNNNDDLYLSDDDDWGMSTSFSTPNTLRERDRYVHTTAGGHGQQQQFSMEGRRSSSAFWDQSSLDGGGGGGLGDIMEISSSSKRGLQEWEREAITRDNIDSFEIGNDDYYHSEQRTRSPPSSRTLSSSSGGMDPPPSSSSASSPSGNRNNNAYAEVQEDIRSIDNSVEDQDQNNDDDDTASSSSSKQDEVVNAYRDYLKSIRDGGFESYLTTDNNHEGGDGVGEEYDMTPDFDTSGGGDNNNNNNHRQHHHPNGNDDGEDDALERVLDVEEERRVNGSYYDHVYGVRDVRVASSSKNNDGDGGVVGTNAEDQSSPYAAWRAKARTLLQQEREKDRRDMISPSRQILNKFRRQRGNGGNGSSQTRGRARSRSDEDDDRIGITDNLYNASASINSYRLAMCRSMKFRATCIGVCMVLALVSGLSYYGGKSTGTDGGGGGEDGVPDVAIPPKSNGASSSANMKDNSQNLPAGPSDAIINALATFDPIWYDRRTGWEGITFMNAVDFCATHENRVPCPYEIYCNQAVATSGNTPYGGIRPNGEQWSPVSNGANQWVSVGGIFTCQRYTDLHDRKKPEWGITGVSLEHDHGAGGITQNVLCCVDLYNIGALDPFTDWGRQEEMDGVAADTTHETTDLAVVNVPDEIDERDPANAGGNVAASSHNDDLDSQKREKAVIAAFQPIWFSSAHGWTGTSYEDAILFCESYNHMVLCPYAAYCPNGNARAALPGSMVTELDGEEWVPANGPMNTWVQIGKVGGDESTRCTLHHELLGERPQWGIDGTRTEVKHHILCCLM